MKTEVSPEVCLTILNEQEFDEDDMALVIKLAQAVMNDEHIELNYVPSDE